jgi:hypothetical protein
MFVGSGALGSDSGAQFVSSGADFLRIDAG